MEYQTIHTLTTLSHPEETMTGLRTLGLKRTQDTLRDYVQILVLYKQKSDLPLGVTILLNVVLALSEGVPELDSSVTGAGNNLSVISAEADGQNIGGVANEAAGGETSVKVPETKGVVPRRGEGELAVRGDDNIRDEVVVAGEDALGEAVLVLVTGQLPDDDGLVCIRKRSTVP